MTAGATVAGVLPTLTFRHDGEKVAVTLPPRSTLNDVLGALRIWILESGGPEGFSEFTVKDMGTQTVLARISTGGKAIGPCLLPTG